MEARLFKTCLINLLATFSFAMRMHLSQFKVLSGCGFLVELLDNSERNHLVSGGDPHSVNKGVSAGFFCFCVDLSLRGE